MSIRIASKIKKRIPFDFFQVFAFDIVSKIFMIVITILLIRILTLTQYDDIVKFTAISGLFLGILGSGISISYIRYSTEQISRGEKSSVGLHMVSFIIIIGLSLFMLILVPIFTNLYKTSTELVVYASFYGIILSLINMNQAFFQSRESYVKSGIVNNLRNVFMLFALICAIIFFAELDTKVVFLIYIVSGLIALIFGMVKIYKGVHFSDIFSDLSKCKLMIKDSFSIVIYCVFINLLNQVDIIMITNMMTKEDVAMYGIALKYYSLLLTLLPSIQAVLKVRTSKKEYIDDASQRKKFSTSWLKKSGLIIIPSCTLIILTSGIFMPILNGHKYDGSINAFRILVIGVAISYLFASNTSLMITARKYKQLYLLALVALIFNFVANWFFVPIWGINAAAASTLISQAIVNVSATIFIIFDKGELSI